MCVKDMFQMTVVVDVVIIVVVDVVIIFVVDVVVETERRLHREHMWLLTFDRDTCLKNSKG